MGNQNTHGKRQREQNRKEKARVKQERLAARRAEVRVGNGPPIASFAEAYALLGAAPAAPEESIPPRPENSAPAPAKREMPGDRPVTPLAGRPPRR